ncbi:MAG: response regulator [Spirochaetales bacterium]|nr:response regulator [Spirochaetales bacterium]
MKREMVLLISDDSTLVRNNLKRLLADVGSLRIFESRDIESTKTILKELSPDIMLLDLRMPGGTGLEIIKFIRSCGSKIIIIVLSNIATVESREKCLASGADYFFDKSIEHREAISLIKTIVASGSTREELVDE